MTGDTARLGCPHLRRRRRSAGPLGRRCRRAARASTATSGSSTRAAAAAASRRCCWSACPGGRVVALDGSPAMIDQARRRLERFGDRVEFVVADLRDAAAASRSRSTRSSRRRRSTGSTTTRRCTATSPRCSGRAASSSPSTAAWATPRRCGPSSRRSATAGPATCSSPSRTRRGGGWRRPASRTHEAWLQPEPTRFEPGEPFKAFLRTVILGAHLARLPEGERDAFVDEVAARLPSAEIDYVRLNVTARRGTARRGRG